MSFLMGETSTKQMRYGEIGDIIFGGTRDRPPRNVAEFILSLDNIDRAAPVQFNDAEELIKDEEVAHLPACKQYELFTNLLELRL